MLQENMVSQTLLIMRTYKGKDENVTKWARNKIALEAVDEKTKYERVF